MSLSQKSIGRRKGKAGTSKRIREKRTLKSQEKKKAISIRAVQAEKPVT